jgi:hypothetical protein
MAKITSISEHFQHFLADLKESFWGDLEGRTKLAWKHFLDGESERMRDQYMVLTVMNEALGGYRITATATTKGTL